MPLFRSRRRVPVTTTTRTTRTARKPSLLYRLTHSSRRNAHPVSTAGSTTTTRRGTRTHRTRRAPMTTTGVSRKPTIGDKIHGAAKVMAGTLMFNRRKKRQGEAMQVHGTSSTTSRHRRRW